MQEFDGGWIEVENFNSLHYSKEKVLCDSLKEFSMASATMTSKGQITIPSAIRTALGLDTGSRVEFIENGKGQYAIVPATSPVTALKGILEKPKKLVTIADMNDAIEKAAGKK